MLTLRLQRTGRKKLAHYRLIAQEHSLSPKSGRVVEFLGSFNPYKKEFTFDKEKVEKHLGNGAQPSNRVAKLLHAEGVKLPSWVSIHTHAESKPKKEPKEKAPQATEVEPAAEEIVEAPAEEPSAEEKTAEPEPEAEVSEKDENEASAEETTEAEESAPAEVAEDEVPADAEEDTKA